MIKINNNGTIYDEPKVIDDFGHLIILKKCFNLFIFFGLISFFFYLVLVRLTSKTQFHFFTIIIKIQTKHLIYLKQKKNY